MVECSVESFLHKDFRSYCICIYSQTVWWRFFLSHQNKHSSSSNYIVTWTYTNILAGATVSVLSNELLSVRHGSVVSNLYSSFLVDQFITEYWPYFHQGLCFFPISKGYVDLQSHWNWWDLSILSKCLMESSLLWYCSLTSKLHPNFLLDQITTECCCDSRMVWVLLCPVCWCSHTEVLFSYGAVTLKFCLVMVQSYWSFFHLGCSHTEVLFSYSAVTLRFWSVMVQSHWGFIQLWCSHTEVLFSYGAVTLRFWVEQEKSPMTNT